MDALVNEFELLVRSARLHSERRTDGDSVTVHVRGKNGTAEVDFTDDDITGMIDGDVVHGWRVFPNPEDVRACAKKIWDIIG